VPPKPASGGVLGAFLSSDEAIFFFLMTAATSEASDPRALTIENVERTLDELRPYLMADGGNVEVVEIDGPIVKVRLQGACGSCPSSTMTLKMGIERKLREAIPEVSEVVQVL
jgi:Fe-S cluster biogenesis protein NfuA